MGSLLMLLLVIDRRAKIAARNRALVELAKASEDQEKTKAARFADLEKRREELRAERQAKLAEREAKRAELERQHLDLADQQRIDREKAKALEEKTQGVRHQALTLQQKLHAEIAALERAAQGLKDEQAQIQATSQKAASTQTTLARMTADLESLEQSLADLKAARKREQQTYSLVPYKGKRGDSRRPLYVECTELGIIFHPDKKLVVDSRTAGYQFREEVEKRVSLQTETIKTTSAKSDQTPYLFVLVRPNGITSYYHFLSSLQGMKLDFGYEFIEPDWILDFTDAEKAAANNSWNTASQSIPGSLGPRPDPIRPGLGKPIVGLRPGDTLANGSERLNTKVDGAGGEGGPESINGASSSSTPGTAKGTPSAVPGPSQSASIRTPGNVDVPVFGRDDGSFTPHFGPPPRPGGYFANSGGNSDGPSTGNRVGSVGAAGEEGPGIPRLAPPSGGGNGGVLQNGGSGLGKGPEKSSVEQGNSESGDIQHSNSGRSGGFASRRGNAGSLRSKSSGSADNLGGFPNEDESTGMGEAGRSPTAVKSASGRSQSGNASSGGGGGQQNETTPGSPDGKSNGTSQGSRGSTGNSGQLNPSSVKADPSSGGGQGNADEPATEEVNNKNAGSNPTASAGSGRGTPGSRSGGNDEAEGGSPFVPPSPFPNSTKPEKKTARLPRLTGNRDWFIPVECTKEGVLLPSAKLKITRNELMKDPNKAVALIDAIKTIIDRRQAAVRPGEPAFRPQLRFVVQADGLRTYHQVYPILETLKLPMTRQDVGPPESAEPTFPVH
jgi:hypothetical protein